MSAPWVRLAPRCVFDWTAWLYGVYVWHSVLGVESGRVLHPVGAVHAACVRWTRGNNQPRNYWLPARSRPLTTPLVAHRCVAGIVTDLHVFVRTDFHVMFTAFFLYTMAMIAMAFAFASVINTTKAGNIASFLLFVVGMVVQIFNITGLGCVLYMLCAGCHAVRL